jgi:hypothetical protein
MPEGYWILDLMYNINNIYIFTERERERDRHKVDINSQCQYYRYRSKIIIIIIIIFVSLIFYASKSMLCPPKMVDRAWREDRRNPTSSAISLPGAGRTRAGQA